MEDRWTNKNIDLSVLTDCIVQFFMERRFVTSVENSDGEYQIAARPRPFHGIVEDIEVSIRGRPDDFEVKFLAGSRSSALVRLGTLTAAFGGGVFTLKGLKSHESLEKLEKEFWLYVDRVVWGLADSTVSTGKGS